MNNLKIKFTSYKAIGDHIEYSIQVDDVITGDTWLLSHRYSYLRTIYRALKKISPTLSFPKKKFFNNKNQLFLEKRKNAVEGFFSNVFENQTLEKALQDLKFLKPEGKLLRKEIKKCEDSVLS